MMCPVDEALLDVMMLSEAFIVVFVVKVRFNLLPLTLTTASVTAAFLDFKSLAFDQFRLLSHGNI